VDDGTLPEANPTFEGPFGARWMLVGQAPGPAERETRRPFSGRAGKELTRWMLRAGFASEEDFRAHVYICSVIRCFPGRTPDNRGDRRPPPRAIANCRPWMDAELELLRPRVIVAVGQLAIERFLGPGRLEERVGQSFGRKPVVVPLPHPSGQSRWLNDEPNRERLARAIGLLSELRSS
jgi:uracil-DNA glycosylase